MQVQNIQRYIIWGLLAGVGFLILIQWQKDYGNNSNALTVPIENTSITQDKTSKAINDDLPAINTEISNDISTQEVVNKTIRIRTNTLDLLVDLKGGDIVQVNLPKHAISIEDPDQEITLLQNDITRTYIAQSGLIGADGPDSKQSGRPIYYSQQEEYILEHNQQVLTVPIIFKDQNGVIITKTFILKNDSYLVELSYDINNQSSTPWFGNLFAQIKRDNTIDPLADTSLFAMKPFLGVAYWDENKKYNKISLNDIPEEPLKVTHQSGWLAFVQHYFISAWIAPKELTNTFETRVNKQQQNIIGFTTEAKRIDAGQSEKISFSFYAGPKDQKTLEKISEGLDLTVDYGWLWIIAQILYLVLINIQSVVGNWGWSIILLTCFIKLLFFPLNQYAFKSMANMRKLQPKMQRLKEQYGEDRQKLSQATMEMYRKEKINPLGSCLPMLIQMPVFIALYWVLSESVEIRHAPFLGWIEDLSIMDPYFILPILMAVSMVLQQKLSPMVFQDPMQERVMKIMPVMFAVFFLFFPAGLVLYWLVNNILTITQQWFINKKLEEK